MTFPALPNSKHDLQKACGSFLGTIFRERKQIEDAAARK